jgi:hypothetical protein
MWSSWHAILMRRPTSLPKNPTSLSVIKPQAHTSNHVVYSVIQQRLYSPPKNDLMVYIASTHAFSKFVYEGLEVQILNLIPHVPASYLLMK